MSKEINVAGIIQANTFADNELLLMNKYFLEYIAGSKNNNNKNRMRDQSTYSYCLLSKNVYPFLFYFSLVYEILEPSFSPLVQQVFI